MGSPKIIIVTTFPYIMSQNRYRIFVYRRLYIMWQWLQYIWLCLHICSCVSEL